MNILEYDQGGCRSKWHNCIPQDIDTSCRFDNEPRWFPQLFFGMYLTKYQNLRIGFQAYFKNIPRKNYPPLKSKKMSFFSLLCLLKKKFFDTFFFYSTLKSIFWGFHQSQLQAILPKKRVAIVNKKWKNYKNLS
jgi:hypothetical protein